MLKMVNSSDDKTFNQQTIILIDSKVINESVDQNSFNINAEINIETITASLEWKFPDREHHENKKWVSLLLSDLKFAGVKSYNQIEKVVSDNLNWLNSFEKTNPPTDSLNHRFSDIGALRIILTEKFYP